MNNKKSLPKEGFFILIEATSLQSVPFFQFPAL
jgi:hypothetical protein